MTTVKSADSTPSIAAQVLGMRLFKPKRALTLHEVEESSKFIPKKIVENISYGELFGGILMVSSAVGVIAGKFTERTPFQMIMSMLTGVFGVGLTIGGLWAKRGTGDGVSSHQVFNNHARLVEDSKLVNPEDIILTDRNKTNISKHLKEAFLKNQGASLLLVGPPGTGKTSIGKAMKTLLPEASKKALTESNSPLTAEEIDIYEVNPKLYDANMILDFMSGDRLHKITQIIAAANKRVAADKKHVVLIFDEVDESLFRGGEMASDRGSDVNKMSKLLEDVKSSCPRLTVVFTSNTKAGHVSKHMKDGGRRVAAFYLDYPDEAGKVKKIEQVLRTQGREIPDDFDLQVACNPNQKLLLVNEEIQKAGFSMDKNLTYDYGDGEKELLKSIIEGYGRISFAGIEQAVSNALNESEEGKSLTQAIQEQILEEVIIDVGEDKRPQIEALFLKIEKENKLSKKQEESV